MEIIRAGCTIFAWKLGFIRFLTNKLPSVKQLRRLVATSLLALISTQFSWSQQYLKGKDAEKIVPGASRVLMHSKLNTPQFIDLAIPANGDPKSWLIDVLQLPATDDFQLVESQKADEMDFTRLVFQQYHDGYAVEFGQYYVFVRQGEIVRAAGACLSPIEMKKGIMQNREVCLQNAWTHIQSTGLRPVKHADNNPVVKAPEIILNQGVYHLCYEFEVNSVAPFARKNVFVDVYSGKVIQVRERVICTDVPGTANTMYYGTKNIVADMVSAGNYRLKDNARGITTWDLNNGESEASAVYFTDTDNNWTTTTNQDDAAYTCHWALEGTYDYYFNEHSLDSYDGAGAEINAYIHFSTAYTNAFWDGTGLWFGDGGAGYTPLTSVDVVAHEFTHAVTEYSAGLVYSYESGALNESFSDIFGVIVDYELNPDANFLMGDVISTSGTPFRDMSNPNNTDQPDTYQGIFWDASGGDNGGVHTNSQVMNYWFYLLCTGGSGVNDNGDAFTITPIGMDAAGDIAYRTLTSYLTSGSEYFDAREMSIIAAEDLFGACSDEVVQVTNAWYAVGVGELFDAFVTAGMDASRNYACSIPATVNFTSNSMNASIFEWDFGDGNTSTLQNPSHQYLAEGFYTVTLIVNGTSLCGANADTITMVDYIQVVDGSSPVAASCVTNNTSAGAAYGIQHVGFAQIDFSSTNALEDYQDRTCDAMASMVAGDNVLLSITSFGNEYKRAWIDYNNDGIFTEATESVFSSGMQLGLTEGVVHTSPDAVIGVPLRMRITSNNSTIANACSNPNNGQTEDYSVMFSSATEAPIADFIASETSISVGTTVDFSDLSTGGATVWVWSFPGGSPSSSTAQNPSVVYSTPGIYEVTLTAGNGFGADTETKIAYIVVNVAVNMCDDVSSSSSYGILYDSGGPTGDYQDYEYCSFLIQPTCADSIFIDIVSFSTESGYDYLYIYDGIDATGDLLFFDSGTTSVSSVVATSGSAYIVWDADYSITYDGFQLDWNSVLFSVDPITPLMTVSDLTPAFDTPVTFTNVTEGNFISTNWDFGDGDIASGIEVTHNFLTNGTFEVIMEVVQCDTSFSTSQFVTVSGAPEIEVTPLSFDIELACNADTIVTIDISNIGEGELVWSVNGSSSTTGTLNVLALTSGSDLGTEYPNTISAINSYFTDYNLVVSSGTTVAVVEPLLATADVVLFPENESGTTTIYSNLSLLMQQFVNDGGIVIQCYPSSSAANALGLFSVVSSLGVTGDLLTLNDPADPLCEGVAAEFLGPNATLIYNISNSDYVSILDEEVSYPANYSVAGYRDIGSGRAYLLGIDYFENETSADRLLSNMVSNMVINQMPEWILANPESGSVIAGNTQTVDITISAEMLMGGTYEASLVVYSNDPTNPQVIIPVQLLVSGEGELSAGDNCIHLGDLPVNSGETGGIWLYNTGCDTLEISGFTISTDLFDINTNPSSLAPNDSLWLSVSGYLDAAGPFLADIEVLNDVAPFNLCLDANGVLSGGLVFNADSIFVDLGSCGDSLTVHVLATNYNDYPVLVDTYTSSISDGVLDIGALTYGVDLLEEWLNMANTINDGTIENYTLSTSTSTVASVIQAFVNDKDVIIIPEGQSSIASFYTTLNPILNAFVEAGGRVIVCSQPELIYLNNLGLFSTTTSSLLTTGTSCSVDLSSPFAAGMPSTFTSPNATYYISMTNTDAQNIVSYNTYDVAASRAIGMGEVIYFGFDYYDQNTATDQLLYNILQVDVQNLFNNITVVPVPVTIPAGEQLEFDITVSSDSLSNGTYEIPIVFNSNEIPTSTDTVTIVLDITGAPCPDFAYTFNCSNLYSFQNMTINTYSTILWDFGDGSESTLLEPTHLYSAGGSYDVSLTMCNDDGCSTMTQTVVVSTDGVVLAPDCVPNNSILTPSYGIANFEFGTISNASGSSVEGYVDYSCSMMTELTVGDIVPFNIQTYNTEYAYMWIDFNNDGAFDNLTEKFYNATSAVLAHSGFLTVPITAVMDTPLRLRIISDDYTLSSSCSFPYYGQGEDYAVMVVAADGPPVADFIANPVIGSVGQTINFTNLTTGGATSYEWTFESATTTTSNLVNPTNSYGATGLYTVTLIATNEFGSDTMTKVDYINIVNVFNMCSSGISSNQDSGVLYDSGGPSGNYTNNETCTFLISPPCAESITLTVNAFSTESCCDYIYVYDGTSTSGTLLWSDSGTPSLSSVTATSGSMFIYWDTDGSGLSSGFNLSWNSTILSNGPVTADFTISDNNPALSEEVQFTDASAATAMQWYWQFGDGSTSMEQNPMHGYVDPGVYEVTLIAYSCSFSDTTSYTIEVQNAPAISIVPDVYNVYVGCNAGTSEPINIFNEGAGDLIWSVEGEQVEGTLQVLMLTYSTDIAEENAHMIDAINATFTDYVLTESSSSSAAVIGAMINDFDVVLLPETNMGSSFYPSIAAILLDYVSNGGTVIKCGPQSSNDLSNTSLFTAISYSTTSSGALTVNTADDLTSDFPTTMTAANLTTYCNVTNADKVTLISYGTNDVMSYRDIGEGRAYWLGFDYYATNTYASLALSRAVQYNNNFTEVVLPDWLTLIDTAGTVSPGSSQVLNLSVDTSSLVDGYYTTSLPVFSNDPSNPIDSITINVFVNVHPCPSFDLMNGCGGEAILQSTSLNTQNITWTIDGVGVFTGDMVELVFPDAGSYMITMEACNAFTCVSDTQTVEVFLTSPLPAFTCSPVAPATCCTTSAMGLHSTSGVYESNLLINAESYYTDMSCSDIIYMEVGQLTTLEVDFNSQALYGIYIDYNNDLQFTVDELITSGYDNPVSYGFLVSDAAVYGQPIRMRLVLDDNASIANGCNAPEGGSVVDFAVVIIGEELLPVSIFSVGDNNCDANIEFFNASFNADTYFWDFGDGNNSTLENPTHTYAANGTYTVTLTASANGNTDTQSTTVVVYGFDDTVLTTGVQTENELLHFTLVETYDSYEWIFGDGGTSSDPAPYYAYELPGLYTGMVNVSLNGCEHTFTMELEIDAFIGDLPVAEFNTINLNCGPTVYFINNSTNGESYLWSFGDGNFSTDENPVHIYALDGMYDVVLTTYGAAEEDSYNMSVAVHSFADNIQWSGSQIEGQTTQFALGDTYDTYEWSFNDGGTSTEAAPSHVFDIDGFYNVQVHVTVDGCEYTFDLLLEITDNGVLMPVAEFNSINPDCGPTVYFLNSSENAESYLWDFGDGIQSTDANPEHSYTSSGNYTVTLTANNTYGSSEYTTTVVVVIFDDAIMTSGFLFETQPITFSLSGAYDSYSWVFEGSIVSTEASPVHVFDHWGIYETEVTVTLNGCEGTFVITTDIAFDGVEDFLSHAEIVLYPNPTHSMSVLELNHFGSGMPMVELFDITGKLISPCRFISSNGTTQKYLVEPQASGIYLVRVKSGDHERTLRLVMTGK